MGDWCRCGAYVGITEPHSCSAPPMPSYHELGEAVGALSLILAAQALSDRIESDMWDAWDAEVKRDDEERKAREEESLRREREAEKTAMGQLWWFQQEYEPQQVTETSPRVTPRPRKDHPMSDRSSAHIFGRVFELIDRHVPDEKKKRQARHFWKLSLEYDFGPSDMYCDPALKRLGLARVGVDPSYPEEGKTVLYLGDDGFTDAPSGGPDT